MNLRRIVSLTASLSFVLMVLTSIVLYVVPQGRVAYWADWRLWGLTKTDWGNLHINLGLLFLVALAVHVYYNWKAIVLYLKDKTRKIKIFTPEFNIALLITAAFVAGTYGGLAPFGWIQSLNDHLKASAAAEYGEPPYGHAELSSLRTFAQKTGLSLENSMALLHQAGYPVEDGASTLQSIATRYGVSPQQLYDVIKPAAQRSVGSPSRPGLLPESPPPGTGNLTLAEFCARFGLNSTLILSGLSGKGITASAEATLKEIASQYQTSPMDLYEILKAIAAGIG